MSKTWKWIIAVLVVLAVVALIAAPFILRGALLSSSARAMAQAHGWDGPPMGRPFDNWQRHPMSASGFLPFGGLFMGLGMLLSLAIPLGLLFGVIYYAVRLALKNSLPVVAPPPAAPAATHPCPKCGYPLEYGWKFCPDCGKKL